MKRIGMYGAATVLTALAAVTVAPAAHAHGSYGTSHGYRGQSAHVHVCTYKRVPVTDYYYDSCGHAVAYTKYVRVRTCDRYHVSRSAYRSHGHGHKSYGKPRHGYYRYEHGHSSRHRGGHYRRH